LSTVALSSTHPLPDRDVLETLRIKQLKSVLEYMGVDYGDAVEKKDLIHKIIEKRSS